MKEFFPKSARNYLAIFCLIVAPYTYADEGSGSEERGVSDEQYYAIQEARAQEDAERLQEAGEEVQALVSRSMLFSREPIEEEAREEIRTSGCYACQKYKGQYAYHGIFQKPVQFSPNDSFIILEDGTQWEVASYDVWKVRDWSSNAHQVMVMPNRWFLSSYRYEMINIMTNQSVQVNRVSDPTVYPHQIALIDYDHGRILLTEGADAYGNLLFSYWKVSPSDIRKWEPRDRIFVGANIGFASYGSPYVLVNVETRVYASAVYEKTDFYR